MTTAINTPHLGAIHAEEPVNRELATTLDRISETLAAVEELRALEQHVVALAENARKSRRDQTDLRREWADACERIASLEIKVAAILEMLTDKAAHASAG